MNSYFNNWNDSGSWRASMSYVTGTHSFKVGYQGYYAIYNTLMVTNDSLLAYRFQNRIRQSVHVPPADLADGRSHENQRALRAGHLDTRAPDVAGRLRYDHAWSLSPAEGNGNDVTSRFNAAPITFPLTPGVDAFNDITPRFGAAYDLFGNGKTAIKFNLGHYLSPATNDSRYTLNNPAQARRRSSRRWTATGPTTTATTSSTATS